MDFSSALQFVASTFSAISLDWLILAGVVVFFAFDALRAGPARVTALAMALPIALLLSESVRDAAYLGNFVGNSSPAVQTGVFIAVAVGLFVALYRIVDFGADSMHPAQAALAGTACAVVLTVVVLQLPDTTLPWTFTEKFRIVFGEAYRLYWLVGAYFALAISRG